MDMVKYEAYTRGFRIAVAKGETLTDEQVKDLEILIQKLKEN